MAEAAPETDHPAPDAAAASAARTLVSGAINAAKASALADEDLTASLRICTLDGVAAQDDADALLSKLAALSVSAALFVTVDGEETKIDSEEALFDVSIDKSTTYESSTVINALVVVVVVVVVEGSLFAICFALPHHPFLVGFHQGPTGHR